MSFITAQIRQGRGWSFSFSHLNLPAVKNIFSQDSSKQCEGGGKVAVSCSNLGAFNQISTRAVLIKLKNRAVVSAAGFQLLGPVLTGSKEKQPSFCLLCNPEDLLSILKQRYVYNHLN